MSEQRTITMPATSAGEPVIHHRTPERAEGSERDRDAFRDGWERVFGGKDREPIESGQYVLRGGKLVKARAADLREADNCNIESLASGCHPSQVKEFNRKFGHMGVKFHPKTGNAIYKDRRSKLRVLKARGYHDRDEVRG